MRQLTIHERYARAHAAHIHIIINNHLLCVPLRAAFICRRQRNDGTSLCLVREWCTLHAKGYKFQFSTNFYFQFQSFFIICVKNTKIYLVRFCIHIYTYNIHTSES